MRSIQEYIEEGLLNKKNIKNILSPEYDKNLPIDRFRSKSVKIVWPVTENCLEWKTMKLERPDKFVVYYDTYHQCRHIASFGGMLDMYLETGVYEDFNPSVIIESFRTLKEAVEFAVNDIQKNNGFYYDSNDFLQDVLSGELNEKYYKDTVLDKHEFVTYTKRDIAELMDMWADVEYPYDKGY